MDRELQEIKKELEAIESLLRQLPVLTALAYIRLNEEFQQAKMQGKRFDDLWELELPNLP